MPKEKEKLIARLLFVPVNGLFTVLLFPPLGNSINNVLYRLTGSNFQFFLRVDTRKTVVFWLIIGWISAHLAFELGNFLFRNFKFQRTLKHLRYSSMAIFILSASMVPAFDQAMIAYSKMQIRNYVFSNSGSVEKPDQILYNDYRHWCGNGAIAREEDLYLGTALEGVDSQKPEIRARSLLMAFMVRDWINGSKPKIMQQALAKTCQDADLMVRDLAENYLNSRSSNCRELLSNQ
ncbi:MAG: hypothetical protein R2747_19715 [Pyrinomonadaceae bacterium]